MLDSWLHFVSEAACCAAALYLKELLASGVGESKPPAYSCVEGTICTAQPELHGHGVAAQLPRICI